MRRDYRRLDGALVRDDGGFRQVPVAEALNVAAEGLQPFRGPAFGMFSCSKATNETNYIAQKFARTVMASNNIDSCNRT